MKIWYFTGDTLLVEYEGRPYKVQLNSDEPPVLLDVNPNDDIETAFERFLKFCLVPWYHARVMPKPKTIANRVRTIFESLKTTQEKDSFLCNQNNHSFSKYQWNALNNQQLGTYTEYFVKMELTMYGFEVYSTEVDDRGIDFIARKHGEPFIEIQVKSLRKYGYVFMQKTKFEIRKNVYLALGLMFEHEAPRLFLIPATTWLKPNEVFVERTYEGLKSAPEWGVNISRKNMAALEKYRFEAAVEALTPEC